MVEEAYQAFKRVLANRKNDKRVEIDGYSDFLFLNRKNYPKVASDYNGMMKGLVKKYNKYNEDKLPISLHIVCDIHSVPTMQMQE